MTHFILNTGQSIPAVGLGTWKGTGESLAQAVEFAIRSGYRHIDSAFVYKNEVEVGKGIANSQIDRRELFVTTKLWCTDHGRVEEALDRSLDRLGLDYVDLYLMHWPLAMHPNPEDVEDTSRKMLDGTRDFNPAVSHLDTWKQMELLPSKKARAIGVSNYSPQYLNEMLDHALVCPAVNQIECHPWLNQDDITRLCMENNIHVTAYSPLGGDGAPLTQKSSICQIASAKNVGAESILLSYHINNGRSVVAKATSESHITSNQVVVDLTEEEIAGLNPRHEVHRSVRPDFKVNLLSHAGILSA